MALSPLFETFIENSPICVMARVILERIFDPGRIDDVFERTAKSGFTRELLFSSLIHLMGDVVLGVRPSVHAAFQALEEANAINVSLTAVYNKLNRVEPVVSAALVRESAFEAGRLIDTLEARLPTWLPGYRCRILDGNAPSATEHRIEELRYTWAAPLPGKILVVLDQERMLAEEVFLTEDGHAGERSLLPDLVNCVQPRDVWIADRNFCTIPFMFDIHGRGACFAIRQHGSLKGTLVGRRRKIGRGSTGMVYEQTISLTGRDEGQTLEFRRITVQLTQATRDGDVELHILTNLPQADADAVAIAELYRKRWTIETLFAEVTKTLQCEIQTLGYPKAALLAFCLALQASNAVAVLKAALRTVHGAEKVQKEVSGYFLSLEIKGVYAGMMIAIPDKHWKPFRKLPLSKLAALLIRMARHAKLARYKKHPRGPKKPPPKKTAYKNGGHVSTFKLINGIE
jgi:hypothetical protein